MNSQELSRLTQTPTSSNIGTMGTSHEIKRWSLGIAFIELVMLAGCTTADTPVDNTTSTILGTDGPAIIATSRLNAVDDALIEGRLVFEDDCLYLESLGGSGRSLVMWPRGAKWQEDPPAVIIAPGIVGEPGDVITGGGGTHAVGGIRTFTDDPAALDLAFKCNPSGFLQVAVLQTGAKSLGR